MSNLSRILYFFSRKPINGAIVVKPQPPEKHSILFKTRINTIKKIEPEAFKTTDSLSSVIQNNRPIVRTSRYISKYHKKPVYPALVIWNGAPWWLGNSTTLKNHCQTNDANFIIHFYILFFLLFIVLLNYFIKLFQDLCYKIIHS